MKEQEEKKLNFTVDLETWDCYGNHHNPRHHIMDMHGNLKGVMLNSKSGMCCLGFACHSLGVPKDNLDADMPYSVSSKYREDLIDYGLLFLQSEHTCSSYLDNSPLSERAQEINDDGNMGVNKKMEMLHKLFSQEGHTIVFKLKGEQVYPEPEVKEESA